MWKKLSNSCRIKFSTYRITVCGATLGMWSNIKCIQRTVVLKQRHRLGQEESSGKRRKKIVTRRKHLRTILGEMRSVAVPGAAESKLKQWGLGKFNSAWTSNQTTTRIKLQHGEQKESNSFIHKALPRLGVALTLGFKDTNLPTTSTKQQKSLGNF